MKTRYLITLALLAACIRPEEGIDNTRIRGTVVAAPTEIEEFDERQNGTLATGNELGDLNFGITSIAGVVRDYHVNPERPEGSGPTPPPDTGADTGTTDTGGSDTETGDTSGTDTETDTDTPSDSADTADTGVGDPYAEPLDEDADQDWYLFTPPVDVTMTIDLSFEGAEDTLVRLGLYEAGATADEDGVYEPLDEEDFSAATSDTAGTAGGTYSMTVELTGGEDYALRVAGLYGTNAEKSMAYTLRLAGLHPDDAGVLVGAYPSADGGAPAANDRGNPVAGSTVSGFELQDDDSYVGTYEMYLVREVDTTPDSDTSDTENDSLTVTNEAVTEVYIFAGTWSGTDALNKALPAGTWYSSEPSYLDLSAATTLVDTASELEWEYVSAEPVVVDANAPLVPGYYFVDTEPNDMTVDVGTFTLDVSDPSLAQDIGPISVEGFVDFFNGTIPFKTADAGFVHDSDVYMFTVEEKSTVFFEMGWDSDADLDVIIFDANGDPLDWAASLANPESSGGFSTLEVDESYFLAVLGYLGEPGSTSTYEVVVEPVGL